MATRDNKQFCLCFHHKTFYRCRENKEDHLHCVFCGEKLETNQELKKVLYTYNHLQKNAQIYDYRGNCKELKKLGIL